MEGINNQGFRGYPKNMAIHPMAKNEARDFTEDGLIVKISDGYIKGKICRTEIGKEYISFTGIPYAEPTVGKLRFKEPVPAKSWFGLKDTTSDDHAFLHFHVIYKQVMGSEELLINVYKPKRKQDVAMPVFVYFHGGIFKTGSASKPEVGPDFLIDKDDIVVVSVQSRLGVFGYLCLDIPEAPGNLGNKDQVLALKWIQKNISVFGGDPSNVTLCGFSTGAALAEFHTLSPMSRGLFHKVICHSGSVLNPMMIHHDPIALAFKLGRTLGCKSDDKLELLRFFETVPAHDLVMATPATKHDKTSRRGGFHAEFGPVVEKRFSNVSCFIDDHPMQYLIQGRCANVPILTGFAEKEGFSTYYLHPERVHEVMEISDFISYIPYAIPNDHREIVRSKLDETYKSQQNQYDDKKNLVIDFFGDVDFTAGVLMSSNLHSVHNPNVYLYHFTYDGAYNTFKKMLQIDFKGAMHCDQDGYVIHRPLRVGSSVNEVDMLVQNRILTMWIDFMKNGNPTPKPSELINIKWEPVTPNAMNCLHIGEELRMDSNFIKKRWNLWRQILSFPIL